ncbi:hypothetical protein HELRODRAFT_185689 [Helobdella robusta]|uniref:Transmembrane protein 177 n=1 Tax=Helobdella robusta TaxID=6412 RepID=T1FN55_HELRO|nr:hypothetical protein HELRODRAFT_185689 [Helobdella robusta]ESO01575.1 hypothetical protein HELRODRAFT_185689 [Helobdella robusta]
MWQKLQQFVMSSGIDLAALGLASGIIVSMLPKTVFIKKLREAEHYVKEDGEERKISKENSNLIQNILKKFDLHPIEHNNITFFTSSLSDPTCYGSVKAKFGALIGLPVTIDYDESSRLGKESLSFGGIRLDLNKSNSDVATQLAESLLLSDKAKAFVIARQLSYVSTYNLHTEVALKSVMAACIIYSMHYVKKHYREFIEKLRPLPYFLLGCTILSGWGVLYIGLKDARKCRMDYVADRKAALLGRELAEGGVEYYESLLRRNKSLRILTKSGPSKFTAFGNEATLLRQNGLQITTRRDNLLKLLDTYNKVEGEKESGSKWADGASISKDKI